MGAGKQDFTEHVVIENDLKVFTRKLMLRLRFVFRSACFIVGTSAVDGPRVTDRRDQCT